MVLPPPPPPLRLDINREGGGLIIYISSDIPCKTLKTQLPTNMEGIFIELNIRNKKWLMFCGYNLTNYLNNVGIDIDNLMGNYVNMIIIGDFNSEMEEEKMKYFCEIYNLQKLIKEPTCFKSVQNPTSILTNKIESFKNSFTLETGLSDNHEIIITALKQILLK